MRLREMRPYAETASQQDEILLPTKNGYITIPAPDIRRQRIESKEYNQPLEKKNFRSNSTVLNFLHLAVMMSAMIAIVGYLGYAIGGVLGLTIMSAVTAGLFFGSSNIKIEHYLKFKKVKPIFPEQSRELYSMIKELTRSGNLSSAPALFYSNSAAMNAYTLQDSKKAAIVVTGGLLNHLNKREIFAVLAHEISHLKNNDVKVMLVARQIHKITSFMAFIGQVLLFINLPLILMGQLIVPWSLVLFLIGAPLTNLLLMAAISRNREYKADIDAVLLAGDPLYLASALQKIQQQARYWKRLYAPYLKSLPSVLHSHPSTSERIRRLKLMAHEERLSV